MPSPWRWPAKEKVVKSNKKKAKEASTWPNRAWFVFVQTFFPKNNETRRLVSRRANPLSDASGRPGGSRNYLMLVMLHAVDHLS